MSMPEKQILYVNPPIEEYMTKRERIAAMCLQGILSAENELAYIACEDDPGTVWPMQRAKAAVEHADALLKALEQP